MVNVAPSYGSMQSKCIGMTRRDSVGSVGEAALVGGPQTPWCHVMASDGEELSRTSTGIMLIT
jgi:hypothetical protein